MENPIKENIIEVKRILKYLKGTVNTGILYRHESTTSDLQLQAFCDADYAGSGPGGKLKSTSGYVLMCCSGPVTWCSRRQAMVAQATAEAEYIAAADCSKERSQRSPS